MLDDLVAVIKKLQQRIRDHGPSLQEGSAREMRTRTVLIDPLLRVLGWDVSDPSLVTLEHAVGNGRADYALLNDSGTPIAFIEAKHLGEPLERQQHEDQVFTYALRQQVKFAALTDGNRWILDDVSVFSGERRMLDLSLAHTESYELALKVLLLWRPNLASSKPVPASEPIFGDGGNVVSRDEDDPPPPPPPEGEDWVTLDSFIRQNPTKQPVSIRFPDGTQEPVGPWYHLVTSTARWLWSSDKLTPGNVPVPTPGKGNGYLLALQGPALNSNRSLKATNIDGTPLWFDRQGSGHDFRQRTLTLLAHCKVNPAMVIVQVGE